MIIRVRGGNSYVVGNARPFFAASEHIRKWRPKFVIMETVMAALSKGKKRCPPTMRASKFYEAHYIITFVL